MRPTLLKFGGIGAYPKDVVVDFEELSKKGLYLVVGPTGSGKTTIFDAMTFALYGKTASDREGMFVSDHDNSVDPYVELHFTHQGRRFIAHREPAKDKTKNPVPSKQWFREVDDSDKIIRTETGSKTVSSEAVELLGLDAEQFMQVVLLPQNKFQKFLVSNSKDRKPLLQKIFGTGLYARVADQLKHTAKSLEEEAEQVQRDIAIAHGTAHATLSGLNDQPYFSELDHTAPENNTLAEVIGVLNTALHTITAQDQEINARFTEVVQAKAVAQEDLSRFNAAQEKDELEKAQDAAKKDVQSAKKKLEKTERAQRVLDASEKTQGLSDAAELSRRKAHALREELSKAVKKLAINAESIANLKNALPTATAATLTAELTRVHQRVTETINAIDELNRLNSDIKAVEIDIKDIKKNIDANKKLLTRSTDDLKLKKDEEKASNAAEKKLPSLEKKINDLESLIDSADIDGATKALTKASTEWEKLQKAFNDAESQLGKARRERIRHLAGELAESLSKDDECPVCGSTSHPKKAKKTAEIDISVLEKKRDKAQSKKAEAESFVSEMEKALQAAQTAHKKLPSDADQQKLRDLFDETAAKAELCEEISEEVEMLTHTIAEIRDDISSDELALQAKTTETDQKLLRVAVLEPIATSLGKPKAVTEADIILKSAIGDIDQLEYAESQAEQVEASSTQAEKQLKSILETERFSSVKDARDAFLDEEATFALSTSIEDYETRAGRILLLSGTIGDTAPPKVRPDLEQLTKQEQEVSLAREASSASMSKTSNAIKSLETVLQKIDKLGPESQEKVERAESARALARIVEHGAGSGENKQLGLEEWVQRTLFEEVCIVATTQLRKLSNNRYFLTLEPEGAKMKSRAGGLELYVLDSHNGKTRSVQTLSGGEQFLTSLALALALAEVVERHAGGMELSTLFIDEGFGSLDTETLEQATAVLTKLQDIGRTVGLITHVELMQERLPIGIRIEKTNSGSTLALVD
jgi:exonuclease SbcC